MPLPPFNTNGDLPAGVHAISLRDAIERFGKPTVRRKVLAGRLERIYRLARQTGQVARFVVFGSFVTDKPQPNDVDVFIVMDDNFDYGKAVGETRLLFDHASAQDHFGASVFWLRRIAAFGGEDAAIEQWQIKRDGTKRGILEITSE